MPSHNYPRVLVFSSRRGLPSSSTPLLFSSRGRHFHGVLTLSSWVCGLVWVGKALSCVCARRLVPSLAPSARHRSPILGRVRAPWGRAVLVLRLLGELQPGCPALPACALPAMYPLLPACALQVPRAPGAHGSPPACSRCPALPACALPMPGAPPLRAPCTARSRCSPLLACAHPRGASPWAQTSRKPAPTQPCCQLSLSPDLEFLP